jgi:hypothetical protein
MALGTYRYSFMSMLHFALSAGSLARALQYFSIVTSTRELPWRQLTTSGERDDQMRINAMIVYATRDVPNRTIRLRHKYLCFTI